MNPTKMQERDAVRFAHFLQGEEKSEATVRKYLHDVRHFLRFADGAAVDRNTVLDYKSRLGADFAVASANSMLAALNAFLRFLGKTELCVKRFRIQRRAFCPEEKELSRAEYLRLLNTAKRCDNERLCLVLQTLCATGIRVSELQYITVEAAAQGEATVHCKGKLRRIFLVPELKKKLLRYAKEQGRCHGTIFVTRAGKPLDRHCIWREMKNLCAQAGVAPGKVFPHNLRHLFARTFFGIEKDIAKLADILGHSSINTTRTYIITTGAEHRQKMALLHLTL